MTMPNPNFRKPSFSRRLADSLTPKAIFLIALGVAGWHYGDLLALEKVHAEVSSQTSGLHQQNRDQESHLKSLDTVLATKVDRDSYDRDIRVLSDQMNGIRTSLDALNRTLLETHR